MGRLRNNNQVTAIFFLGIGIFFSLYARSVDIGRWARPGPGFLPFWAGITLAAMSLGLLLRSFWQKAETVGSSFFPEKDSWKRVLSTFLALLFHTLVLPYLGFTLTTFLFLAFLFRFIFPQTWWRTLVTAVLGAIIARLLFINFLETQLPAGIFGI
jgi:hypothetical protein